MKVIFLGTAGWYDTKTANTISCLVETKAQYIVLDAGFGLHKIPEYIKDDKPIYLFISHLHLDHIIGLHCLPLFDLPQGIDIYLPKGMKRFMRQFINRPFTLPPSRLRTKVRMSEIARNTRFDFGFEFKKLNHSPICYGYRFRLEDMIISYCTDTGLCPNLYALSRNADLLIVESSFRAGEDDRSATHLNPETASRVAKESGAKRLCLIHFDASRYHSPEDRERAGLAAKKIFQNTSCAMDDGKITL